MIVVGCMMEYTYHARVSTGGRLEVTLPESLDGQEVTVVVRTNGHAVRHAAPPSAFGLLRGKIRMHDNFDDPLDEFKDYQ